MKNSPLNLNASIMNSAMHKQEIEGNGISSTEREASPCSPSPRTEGNEIKSEPMELMCSTNQVRETMFQKTLPTAAKLFEVFEKKEHKNTNRPSQIFLFTVQKSCLDFEKKLICFPILYSVL